jgi:hypothetical protein
LGQDRMRRRGAPTEASIVEVWAAGFTHVRAA